MSKKHYPKYRDWLCVNKAEHILDVRYADGRPFAICYHPTATQGQFPVRYLSSDGVSVRVKFCNGLRDAEDFFSHKQEEAYEALRVKA